MESIIGLKTQSEGLEVEYEIFNPIDLDDSRKLDILNGLQSIEEQLVICENKVEELNSQIDGLTNHADRIDYTVAVASGVLAGILDIFFVGEFDLDDAKAKTHRQVNEYIMKYAEKDSKFRTEETDRLSKAIGFLL